VRDPFVPDYDDDGAVHVASLAHGGTVMFHGRAGITVCPACKLDVVSHLLSVHRASEACAERVAYNELLRKRNEQVAELKAQMERKREEENARYGHR
jgi:hypothetical protein